MRDAIPETGANRNENADHALGSPAPGGDWFHLSLFEWMWRVDGLGLRPGAELMVYATIYRASAHGGGAFVATNASLAHILGYPRETVSRAVNKLRRAGLVWVVGHIKDPHGGKAVRCYAVCQPAIDRVQGKLSARHLLGYLSPMGTRPTLGMAAPAVIQSGDITAVTEGAIDPQAEGNVTKRHASGRTPEGSFQQNLTHRHTAGGSHDEASCNGDDGLSHVTGRPIDQNGLQPAQTQISEAPLINTYYLKLTNQEDEERDRSAEGQAEGPAADPLVALATRLGMRVNDYLAFADLVGRSVRPVDEGYLDKNLRAFNALLDGGITADVILEAYDAYADYQQRMLVEHGEMRPMHLLKWLRQTPNSNIAYVLRARDERWRRSRAEVTSRPQRPTHEDPRLERLIDGGIHLWFATDERGGRVIAGSHGVESRTQALALYEEMYRNETLEAGGAR